METIVKTISSEDAKNRFFSNHMPYISSNDLTKKDDGKCWGNYPLDVKITPNDTYHMYEIKDNLPLVNNNGEYIFRYYNIKDLRIWLENFIKECIFYKKAYRGGSYRWYQVDGDFYSGDTLDIYTMLGDDISANVCDVVCVNSNADIFNNIFRLSGDTTRYELLFIEFVDDIFSNSKTYEYSIPYFNLPVYIDSIGKTIGDMVTDEQEWTPGKKYFIGEMIDVFNTKINQYLPFFFEEDVKITFDKNLNETIKMDEFEVGFSSFSQGQRQRAELAINFALFDVARIFFSNDNKLLILDEMDKGLDKFGIKAMINLLKGFDKQLKIFIVSHNPLMDEEIDTKIKISRDTNGFSILG